MKKILLFVFVSLLLFSCSSNKKKERMLANLEDTPLVGDTTAVKKQHALPAFHSISVYDASTIEVVLGDKYELEIDGAKVYADAQEVNVNDGELVVKYADHDSNHRKTGVRVTVPTLQSIQVVGCGKLTMLGSECKTSKIDIDLQRVNVAILSPCLTADNVSLSLKGVMFSQFRVDCNHLDISAHSVSHVKVLGKAKSKAIDSDSPKTIDISGLKRI